MSSINDKTPDEAAIASLLGEAMQAVRSHGDIGSLDSWRASFKKHVPLFMRSYVAAYLMMGALGGQPASRQRQRDGRQDGGRRDRGRQDDGRQDGRKRQEVQRQEGPRGDRGDDRGRQQKAPQQQSQQRREDQPPRVVLDPDKAIMLFVGAGRKRRVRSRDLAELFISKAGLRREDIGEVRVLDNYSFVQVLTVVAEKAIASLNGIEYAGRNLVVNLARKREEAPSPQPSEEAPCLTGADAEGLVDDSPMTDEARGELPAADGILDDDSIPGGNPFDSDEESR